MTCGLAGFKRRRLAISQASTYIGMIITRAQFQLNRFRGYGATVGLVPIFPFPVGLHIDHDPYKQLVVVVASALDCIYAESHVAVFADQCSSPLTVSSISIYSYKSS